MTRRLIVAGALLMALHPARLDAQPLTVGQFTNRIDALARAVREADAPAAVRLAASVPAFERVSAAGQSYDVPLDWLRSALAIAPEAGTRWPDRRQLLAHRLDTMSAEARLLDEAVRRTDAPQDVLANVLADRRFAAARATTWQAALRERIRQWLFDLFSRMSGRGWSSRIVMQAIAWGVSIAALMVLLVWLTGMSLRRRRDTPIGVGPAGAIVPPGHVLGAEAAELIRAGRLREGARAAYRAALRRLEEEGVVRPDAARTPRETLRLVAPAHRRAAPLSAITSVFERIWYGSRPAGEIDASRLLGLLQEFDCLPPDRAKS